MNDKEKRIAYLKAVEAKALTNFERDADLTYNMCLAVENEREEYEGIEPVDLEALVSPDTAYYAAFRESSSAVAHPNTKSIFEGISTETIAALHDIYLIDGVNIGEASPDGSVGTTSQKTPFILSQDTRDAFRHDNMAHEAQTAAEDMWRKAYSATYLPLPGAIFGFGPTSQNTDLEQYEKAQDYFEKRCEERHRFDYKDISQVDESSPKSGQCFARSIDIDGWKEVECEGAYSR